MRITATQIEQWADTRDAQGILPILIRRLISVTTTITALSMPGGDSVSSSGWDGIVQADKGNIWVPDGASFWEMGCSSDIITKARSDLRKRNQQISPQEAAKSRFVFVSPRRWPKKIAGSKKFGLKTSGSTFMHLMLTIWRRGWKTLRL